MNAVADSRDHYSAEFRRLRAEAKEAPWLRQLREQAFGRFVEQGFPTTRHEDWKYTSVAAIESSRFEFPLKEIGEVTAEAVASFRFDQTSHLLVFVNGHFAPKLSQLQSLPAGAVIGSLAEELGREPELLEPLLSRYASYQAHAFTALSTALLQDGAYLNIPAQTAIAEPIHLLFVSTASDKSLMSQPRNLLVAGEGSSATVVEHYVSLAGEAVYFTNAVTEIIAGRNAQIEHIKLQEESLKAFHVATIQAHQGAGSRVVSHSISLGAQLARNDINMVLAAEGANCQLNGLYLAAGRQHVDHHTRVDHVSPGCSSREFYKGILDGRARGVFNGRVIVHRNAQQSDAQQTNNNLLLSRDAEIDTKPQLEIFADDVKCSHGATVGQLDENMIFYLRSRGVDESSARSMLTYAFASEVLGHIAAASVRRGIETRLTARLPGGGEIKEVCIHEHA